MKLSRLAILCLSTVVSACAAHRGAPPLPPPPATPYTLALAPSRPLTPEAAEEARRQDELNAAQVAAVVAGVPVKLARIPESPADPKQAVALAKAAGADAILWSEVGSAGGKVSVQNLGFDSSGNNLAGLPAKSYEPSDAGARADRELQMRMLVQAVLYTANLSYMLRVQPELAAETLKGMKQTHPKDWVGWNPDLIERRWGMQGRLLRDGKATEEGYRRALAIIADMLQQSCNDPQVKKYLDPKEAFYTVGLARGFLLQKRPEAAVEALAPMLERFPQDVETRRLLGRAYLAKGDVANGARVLEPTVQGGVDGVAIRMYAATLKGDAVREAFAPLLAKNAEDLTARLYQYVATGGATASELKSFLAAHPKLEWPAPVARYFLGEIDQDALWASVRQPDPVFQRAYTCQVHYFLGEASLNGVGRSVDRGEAKKQFEAAVATQAFAQDTYELADFQLEQLRR